MCVRERPRREAPGLRYAPGAAPPGGMSTGELERPAVAANGDGGAGELAQLRGDARGAAGGPAIMHREQLPVIGGEPRPGRAQAPETALVRPRPLDGFPRPISALGAPRAALEGRNHRGVSGALPEQRRRLAKQPLQIGISNELARRHRPRA